MKNLEILVFRAFLSLPVDREDRYLLLDLFIIKTLINVKIDLQENDYKP